MEFRILGPLEVVEQDAPLRLGGGKQRALLAVLLLHANEVVSTDRLVDELWGEDRPPTAAKIVQIYVSQLRRLLADGALLTRRPGYVLRVEPADLDVARFEQLAAEARTSEPAAAAEKLREALALWRGPPLADFAYEQFAQTEIARLEELRLTAVEARIDADMELGRHPELVAELDALVSEHPLREGLRGQLMLALYRCGRQAQALDAYRRGRRLLADELGLEPREELQELEKAILVHDPSLNSLTLAPPAEPAQRPTPRPGSVFIGRQRELGELLEGLEDAVAGRGRLFLISGEPGIGKSRLADELINHARARDARVLVGRCWEAGGAPAYWPWVQAIRAYARESNPESLRAQLGAGAADVAQIVPELGELFPDLATPALPETEGARFRFFDAFATFLKSAGKTQPLVLVLDDLHAADEPSLLLLQFVARELNDSSLLLIAAYRDVDPTVTDPLTTALTELAREPAAQILQLGGLEESDVAHFIELTIARSPAAGLAAKMHAETEGNPLFVGEIVRLLAAEEGLDDSAGLQLPIPQTVKEVIGRRLRHLSDDCNRVLTLASVLGREFDLGALELLSEHDRDGDLEALDEATSARIISEVPGAIGRLRFAHALIRDVVYERLPSRRRLRLHEQVGEALEHFYADDLQPHLAELAHHFYEASPSGDVSKAIGYAVRAAEQAVGLLAFEEAVRLYEMALRLTKAPGLKRCQLLLALGDAQARAGDTPASKRSFREAAKLAQARGLAEQLAHAALGYGGRLVWEVSRDDEYHVSLLEAALDALGDEDSILRVRLLARLAGGPLRDARFPPERREAIGREALEMARRIGDRATLAYALGGYFQSRHSPDNLRMQLAVATEFVDVATEIGDYEQACEGHDQCFDALVGLGDISGAKASLEAMTKLAKELRQPSQDWLVTANWTLLALLEGRLDDAEELILEARRLGERAQSWNAEVSYRLQLYMLRREQGRLAEVADLVRQSSYDYPTYPVWRCVLAQLEAELGREGEARKEFEALAADDFAGLPFDEEWLVGMGLLSETASALSHIDGAAILYERLLPYADRVAIAYPEISTGPVARYLGILASAAGRWDAAASHFEEALELGRRMGARPWFARTQENFAAMRRARGAAGDAEQAAALSAQATEIRHDLGMT
jgi:DNA-binding SARP family transcriptional activator/tetratricopeptide (TPR) repeat protein